MHPHAAARVLERCREDPVLFATKVLGIHPWIVQRAILLAITEDDRVAVRACRGVGKTFIAAVIVLWFLYCHGPNTIVVTTAPTQRQVRELLWAEIRALHKRAEDRGYPLGGDPSTVRLDLGPDWYAIGISSDDPDKYLGFHAHNILFVVDEASGVDQAKLDAAEGYATSWNSKTLFIGNGTQTSGGLYNAFTVERTLWSCIDVSMFQSPNFTRENVAQYPRVREYMERKGLPYSTEQVPEDVRRALPWPKTVDTLLVKWGEDHPLFAVFVLGEFPPEGTNTVIGIQAVKAAMDRYDEWEPTEGVDTCDVVCDVARFGDDETVIVVREHGDIDRLTIVETFVGQATDHTAAAMLRHAAVLEESGLTVDRFVVDDAGVGGGVTDQLRKAKREGKTAASVVGFNGGAKAKDRSKTGFKKARSEAWFHFAERMATVALEPDAQLFADLVAPTYELDADGQRVVEQKKVTKKRLKRSPDRADAVLMAFAPSGFVSEGKKSKGRAYK